RRTRRHRGDAARGHHSRRAVGRGDGARAGREPDRARGKSVSRVRRRGVRRRGDPPDRSRLRDPRDPGSAQLLPVAARDALDRGGSARPRLARLHGGPFRARPPPGSARLMPVRAGALLRAALDAAAVGPALGFIASSFPASVMLTPTTTNGGDMGTHYYPGWYLRHVLL